MRTSLRLVVALGSASLIGAGLLLACSDDTSVNASTDASVPPIPDGGPGTDAPNTPDAADSAPPFDGGFVVDTFDELLATELCKSLARCCYGNPMPAEGGADGGTFDNAACIANLKNFGFQGSNLGTGLKDAGNVTLDQVSADDCVNKVKSLKCDLPGTDYTAALTACFKVYSGKLAPGAACNGTVECQPGNYCKASSTAADAGPAGTCTAIAALGGGCGQNPNSLTEFEETCSYRGSGVNGTFCKWTDPAGPTDLDAGDWKCTAAQAMGTQCVSSTWCKDSICDPVTSLCTSPDMLFQQQCGTFRKP